MPNAITNRRRQKRHHLLEPIVVIDKVHNVTLGQLVNIHQEGLLLIGTPLSLNVTYQITLLLPDSINYETELELSVECLWSQQATPEQEMHWSGCRIADTAAVTQNCIQAIMSTR